MVRIKMPLRIIPGEKHRNATFMKRRAVVKKKAMELGKLCDVATALICYGPRGQLDTWPEDPLDARHVIDSYLALNLSDDAQRHYNLHTFFQAQAKKLQTELQRERSAWLNSLNDASSLQDLLFSLDAKLREIDDRVCLAQAKEEEERREKEMESCWRQLPPFNSFLVEQSDVRFGFQGDCFAPEMAVMPEYAFDPTAVVPFCRGVDGGDRLGGGVDGVMDEGGGWSSVFSLGEGEAFPMGREVGGLEGWAVGFSVPSLMGDDGGFPASEAAMSSPLEEWQILD
ncbi:uncharacterized protein LOC144704980 [Wolffia australiana]